MIIIDSRESRSKIPDKLKTLNVKTRFEQLDIGDYVIIGPTRSACISSKSAEDYIGSIQNDHLNDELYQMSSTYNKAILAIHGQFNPALWYRKTKRETIFQYLAGCITHESPEGVNSSISLVHFTNDYDFAMFLRTLDKLICEDDIYRSPSVKKIKVKPGMEKQITVQTFPHIGPTWAKKLLKLHKTIRNIINLTEDELKSTKGIGDKMSQDLIKHFNEEYEE